MKKLIKFRIWDGEHFNYFDFSDPILVQNGRLALAFPLSGYDLNTENKEVFQQFTGLKDSKRNEIYEGDILLGYDECGSEVKGEVLFDEGEWIFAKDSNYKITKIHSRASVFHWKKSVEVIGNTFENPKLLK